MAGIHTAQELIQEQRNVGTVIASGRTLLGDKYALILVDDDKGTITAFDYGSDVRINADVGDKVKLRILDEYTAEWVKEE